MNNLVNERAGTPPIGYSDLEWQRDLSEIRKQVSPSRFERMKTISEPIRYSGTYHGQTQYQYYCGFINDILMNIRKGKTDYCFYIYQIFELLKYEHDRLQAEWLTEDKCFKVYLKR